MGGIRGRQDTGIVAFPPDGKELLPVVTNNAAPTAVIIMIIIIIMKHSFSLR